jgi:hypothetical protein
MRTELVPRRFASRATHTRLAISAVSNAVRDTTGRIVSFIVIEACLPIAFHKPEYKS